MTDDSLRGAKVVVTGASRGIGQGVAAMFCAEGSTVAGIDLRDGGETAKLCGEGFRHFPCDLAQPEQIASAFAAVDEWFGGAAPDVLVCVAGIAPEVSFIDTPVEVFDEVFAVNVRAVFLCGQEGARRMRAAGGGRIVNIASTASVQAWAMQAVYGASKGAVALLTKCMAIELAAHGITVNAVGPGHDRDAARRALPGRPAHARERARPRAARPSRHARGHRRRRALPGARRALDDGAGHVRRRRLPRRRADDGAGRRDQGQAWTLMDLGLTDARVLVSGGSYGIGREIVRVFLAEGARVAVAARGQERLDALCAELAAGDRLVPLVADVGDAAQVESLAERAIAALGGLDVLIANATANREGRSDDDYQASFAVDLMQSVRLLEAVRTRQPGKPLSVVCTSSIVGKSGDTPEHAYGAAKAALLAFTKNAAVTFGPEGTRVNAVAPGAIFFDGGWWDGVRIRDPEGFARALANIPRGQMGAPEEVADVVCFLASKRAAHVNGATVLVDGGEFKGYA